MERHLWVFLTITKEKTMSTLITHQGMETRYIEAKTRHEGVRDMISAAQRVEKGWALKATKDFVDTCSSHNGIKLSYRRIGLGRYVVDMRDFPEDMGFGGWFQQWAKRWDVEVID